jgi:ubiquinone/menaquinone biosynthesis C-methylase UbiE
MVLEVLLGAREVHGIEIYPGMVATVESYLPLLPDDVSSRIAVTQGDVAAMPYEDSSADVVLSIEAISHYLDVDAFIDEAVRVLRPGGVLIISDGNNATNPLIRRKNSRIWQVAECGPANQTVYGHVMGKPYVEKRQELLRTKFPSLDRTQGAEFARRTAGFTNEQLIEAAHEYLESGKLPNAVYRRGQTAVDPDGTIFERMFSPHDLAQTLERRGYAAKAYGYWGGAGGRPALRTVNRGLTRFSRVTVFTAPSFRVIARKR